MYVCACISFLYLESCTSVVYIVHVHYHTYVTFTCHIIFTVPVLYYTTVPYMYLQHVCHSFKNINCANSKHMVRTCVITRTIHFKLYTVQPLLRCTVYIVTGWRLYLNTNSVIRVVKGFFQYINHSLSVLKAFLPEFKVSLAGKCNTSCFAS